MFNNDQFSSMIWFFVGLVIMYFSISHGLGELGSPFTGFMPFLTGLAMSILSVIGFIKGTRDRVKGKKWKSFMKNVQWQKPLITLIGLCAFILLLNTLGFILTTALLVGFLLRVIQPQKWGVVISGAILTSLVNYLLFVIWLKTQLPKGIFKF